MKFMEKMMSIEIQELPEEIVKKEPLLLGYDPSEEMAITREIIGENADPVNIATASAEYVDAGPDTDFQPGDIIHGDQFDPVRHKTHPNGQPILGSKKQLLLKREYKKSATRKIVDGVKDFFSGGEREEREDEAEIPPAEEIPEEVRELPLSDHMRAKQEEEKAPDREARADPRRQDRDAKRSANAIVLGAGFVVGAEIHRQKDGAAYNDLVDACKEWQEETGHKVDLHPNLAFPVAAVGSVLAMAKNEPACKERLDAAASMVRQNVLGTLGEKFPVLRVLMGGNVTQVEKVAAAEQEQTGDDDE